MMRDNARAARAIAGWVLASIPFGEYDAAVRSIVKVF
jgi:hypothetical protein